MAGETVPLQNISTTSRWGTRRRLWPLRIAVALVSFVVGQALIYHHAAPFLWVLLIVAWPRWRALFGAMAIGGLAGTLTAIGWMPALCLGLLIFLIPVPWRLTRASSTRWALVVLGSLSVYWIGQTYSPMRVIVALLVASGAVLLYWATEREISKISQGLGGESTLLLGLAALGSLIAGLEGWVLGPVLPSVILGGLLILAAAVMSGAAGGAVAGATLGFTLAIRGSDPNGGIGILVAAGFLAGWLGTRSWRLASLGLVAGFVLYAIVIRIPVHLTEFWLSLAIAAGALQLVPASLITLATEWADAMVAGETKDSMVSRLEQIADVMGEMARAFRIEEEPVHHEPNLVDAVVEPVCKKCSLYRACWEDDFYRSYRAMLDLTARGEGEILTPAHMPHDLRRRCIKPDAVVHAANLGLNKEREHARMALRVRESRALAELQLSGVANLIRDMAHEPVIENPRQKPKSTTAMLDYRVGIAKRPRRGGVVTGDADLVREITESQVILGLSDGMGVGPRAAWESGTAMSLLEQLLLAGFSQAMSVRAVNTTLLLRSVDDHFATLDLVLLDRQARGAELVKVAAAPTFIRRGHRVDVVRAHSLPVGILHEVHIEPIYRAIEPADVIVLVTDGVIDGPPLDGGEDRLRGFLSDLPIEDPKLMAETILSFMLGGAEDGRDDAAVMVIEVLAPGSRTRQAEAGRGNGTVHEWKRITPTPIRRKEKSHAHLVH